MKPNVGLIRCRQTEEYCPASTCLEYAREGKGGFEDTGALQIMGVISCGGCPGKNAISRAREMKERGADKIAFASCIHKGTPGNIDYPCPFGQKIQSLIEEKVGLEVIEWTH